MALFSRVLDPAPSVPIAGLEGYELICTEALRTREGLTGTVAPKNGSIAADPQRVCWTDPDRCAAVRAELTRQIGAEDGAIAAALRALYEQVEISLRTPDQDAQGTSDLYAVHAGRICRRGPADSWMPLCNFQAAITEELIRDDGATEHGELCIVGKLATGEPLGTARVPLERFAAMSWPVAAWGTRAVVGAGMGTKDQLREAI